MRVSELRNALEKYNQDDLSQIVVDLYKIIPKKLRDEKAVDTMLADFQQFKEAEKRKRKESKNVSVNDLEHEITEFIQNAYDQNYLAPNQSIKKKDRPKWRFVVRSYIKNLQQIPVDSAEGKRATTLLEKLYEMLCYASEYIIFNTDDPFRSVGIEQDNLFDTVLKRKFAVGMDRETIKSAIKQLINCSLGRETLRSFLINVFISNLKIADTKEIAIEQCIQLKQELEKQKATPAKKSWESEDSEYRRKEKINDIVETIFRLKINLCDYDSAISYFKENILERSKEISLYILLHMLEKYDQKNLWLREYETAVKEGVKPRNQLQFNYQSLKEKGQFANSYFESLEDGW
ncbi:hypothetical protein [Sporolactobacillus spathodeae]|uniref:Uncharacterized protein n=1 Tax=Sporolactobacillus spathodeae TaxID=1465502 RepID=A0ABS2Q738_9BACL|nr:hypothetical protein [Sporolactobacillus spathodeae]MBM7657553.1 hypothetical protein [Sporolactobacillus spathodeae]